MTEPRARRAVNGRIDELDSGTSTREFGYPAQLGVKFRSRDGTWALVGVDTGVGITGARRPEKL